MTSLTYNLQGVGSIPVAVDTTTQAVSNAYLAQIQIFANLYNQRLNNPTQAFTLADFQEAQKAYKALLALAKGGLTVAGQTAPALINYQMANNLDLLLKTFNINNFGSLLAGSSTSPAGAVQALQGWWDLAPAGLGNTINGALTAGSTWESIQAMIELQYVQEGNNQISSSLGTLQSALSATDQAVQFLTQLQNLYNDVTPASTVTIGTNIVIAQTVAVTTIITVTLSDGLGHTTISTITISTNTQATGTTFLHAFQTSGNNVYGAPISVTANPSQTDITTFNNMVSTQLPALITSVMQAAGYNQADISAVLANPTTTPSLTPPPSGSTVSVDASWPNSLANTLANVLNDMQSAQAAAKATGAANANNGLIQYIIDNQNPTTDSSGNVIANPNAGNFGRNLATAEVAAQSINTQQQQQVQQQLYVFQEFYQSASGVLTALTQIIQNMAQAAGQ